MNGNMSPWQRAKQLAASNSSRRLTADPANEPNDVVGMALQGVRANADAHNAARKSPKKIYSGVKSKVAGNIKSIKKAQVKKPADKPDSRQNTNQSPYRE